MNRRGFLGVLGLGTAVPVVGLTLAERTLTTSSQGPVIRSRTPLWEPVQITLREVKGSGLTVKEIDDNFRAIVRRLGEIELYTETIKEKM